MANQNDSFIDEVTEDLRRDRLFLALRRYGWIAVLAIVMLVGAAAWREWSAAREAAAARSFGDALLASEATEGDAAARAAALSAVKAPRPAQAALRDLLAANALAEAGKAAEAARLYDAAAATAAAAGDNVTRDLAMLRSVLVQGQGMDAAARDTALTQLSAAGAPFEMLALELKAVALVHAGREQDAVTLLRQIQQKDGLSQSQRRRLAELLVTLGVDPEPESADPAAAPAGVAIPAPEPAPASVPAPAAPAN